MKDPVCGMNVTKKDVVGIKDGKKYYFCSNDCKDKFLGSTPFYQTEKFGKVFVKILFIIMVLGIAISVYFNKMLIYIGIFFILFSSMKLLDLKGFSVAFSEYDIVAKKIHFYGLIYPFIELILGILFLTGFFVTQGLYVTILITGISSIGVTKNIFSKNKVKCACLGTKINLPLTNVTLFENISMFAMALFLLFF